MTLLGPERVAEILEEARRVRALVVGDLMLDQYITGTVDRISPEAPVPVLRVDAERSAVGGAGNVAANVVSLGGSACVVGCIAEDGNGHSVAGLLDAAGVETEGLVRAPDRPTTVKTRVLARHQQVVRVDREHTSDVSGEVAGMLADRIESLAGECDVLVVEDYNKGVMVPAVIGAVLETAVRHGLPTVIDPKKRRFRDYRGVTVFKPNAKELAGSLGTDLHPEDATWMEETRLELECENLLLTLGEHGLALSGEGGVYLRAPALARDVYDVSGAGDTVTAVVALALAAGASMEEAAILANGAAAIEVSHAGVVPVTASELLTQSRQGNERLQEG